MSDVPPTQIWKDFHQRLGLSDAHRRDLTERRGFADDVIEACGLRSAGPENRAILEELAGIYTPEALARLDLMRKTADGWKPSAQFCGYGKTGRKDEKGEDVWSYEVKPILIPYYDEAGEITFIRPHKGFPKRDPLVDAYDDRHVSLPIYCPHLLRTVSTRPGYPHGADWCVLTEGEFKAMALWMCGIPAIAVPGIQAARTPATLRLLTDTLGKFGIKRVIVAFDNECKDDPKYPAYKPDPWDRYDTVVYAKYTGWALEKAGFQAQIAWLPTEWRDEKGKADWDGALARFLHENRSNGVAKAQREFLRIVAKAAKWNGEIEGGLFPSESQRIVEARLSRLFHVPKLPLGGDEFLQLARRLRDRNPDLSKAFQSCHGCYFTRKTFYKPGPEREAALNALRAERDKEKPDWIAVKELEELLLGWPSPISNFVLFCDYRLRSAQNRTEYLVRVVSIHNEKMVQHVRLNSSAMAKLSEFRKWCIEIGVTWAGGERELQALTADIQARSAHREIFEIEGYGFHKDTGMWKFGDRAFTAEGKLILPDKNLVFWQEGIGYQTDFDLKRPGFGFEQGCPMLGDFDIERAAQSFFLLSRHMKDVIGDYGGWLAVGAMLAYAAHPEILDTYRGAPGLWITGRKGGGKTTVAEWLMSIYGFPCKQVALTANTTGNFVAREMAKYYCLPVWFDEFKAHVTRDDVQDQLKNAFTRGASGKAVNDGTLRTHSVPPNTTPVVTGETGVRDSATRSRYIQITLIDEKSVGDPVARLNEMRTHMKHFRNLGQFVMQRRKEFVEILTRDLDKWVNSPKIAEFIPKTRDRFVYGSAYAAWLAACDMLAREKTEFSSKILSLGREIPDFEIHAATYGSECQSEIAETTYMHQFWDDIYAMVETSVINAENYFFLRFGVLDTEGRLIETREHQVQGTIPIILMAHDAVYWRYEQEVRKAGRDAALTKHDLRREMSREKYWLRCEQGAHVRKQIDGERSRMWAFNLAEHPIGEFLRSKIDDNYKADSSQGSLY